MAKKTDIQYEISEKTCGSISFLNGNDKNIILKCNVCGKTFETDKDSFFKNPICTSKRCLTRAEKLKQIELENEGEYKVIKEFITLDRKSKDFQKVILEHKNCGKQYSVNIKNFLKGRRCPYCTKTPFKTHKEYVSDVNKATDSKFTVESEYKRASEDVILKHTGGCGELFKVKAGAFLSDPRCPLCEKSESRKKSREDYRIEIKEYSKQHNL